MEENSTTMNLGNLQAGGIPAQSIPTTNEAVAPVSDISINTNPVTETTVINTQTISVATEQNNLVQSQPEQPVAPVFTQTSIQTQAQPAIPPVPPTENSVVEKKPEQRTDWDRMIVDRNVLFELLNNIAKTISYEPRIELSTIVQLIFSEKGLEVISSNGSEAYIYQKNTKWTYSSLGEVSICLDSQFLFRLVSKITYPEVLFKRSETNSKVIIVEAGNGTYNLAEKLDPNTGESINIEMPISFDDIVPIPLTNFDKFKSTLSKCISFTSESTANITFNGVYCGKGVIVGSNGDTVCIMDNIPELAAGEFFITKDFAQKILAVNINGNIDIAWKTTEGRVYPSILKIHSIDADNNEIIVTGLLQQDICYTDFPIDGFVQFKQLTFSQNIKVLRSAFAEAVDRTTLFFEINDDKQMTLSMMPNKMNIRSLSGSSDENIRIDGCTEVINTLSMQSDQLNLMLNNVSTSEVNIKADNSNPGLLRIDDEDSLIIISESGGDE